MTVGAVIPGEGTLFAVKISASFVTVGQVLEVNGVKVSIAAIDKTVLSSALHITRPSKLPKPEEMTLKIFFDPSDTVSQNVFTTDVNTPGTVEDFKITFADADTTKATATFSGFVTGFELNGVKVEENIGADVTIQLTTVVTYVAGTP